MGNWVVLNYGTFSPQKDNVYLMYRPPVVTSGSILSICVRDHGRFLEGLGSDLTLPKTVGSVLKNSLTRWDVNINSVQYSTYLLQKFFIYLYTYGLSERDLFFRRCSCIIASSTVFSGNLLESLSPTHWITFLQIFVMNHNVLKHFATNFVFLTYLENKTYQMFQFPSGLESVVYPTYHFR